MFFDDREVEARMLLVASSRRATTVAISRSIRDWSRIMWAREFPKPFLATRNR